MSIWHFILHVTGTDNASGEWYNFWSGFAGDLSIFGALAYYLRRHNCHVQGCYRLGHHQVAGTQYVVCARHYPGSDGGKVSAEHINYLHHKFLKEK